MRADTEAVAQRLALIAHDNKKVDFVAWATFNRETQAQFDLIATTSPGLRRGEAGDAG
jgi:methylglyoxal synthase